MQEFGIDISAYQRGFDFERAMEEGVKFIILRGAYSAPTVIEGGGRDTAFVEFYDRVTALGLPVGVYQYATARTVDEARAEATYLQETVLAGRRFDLPVYYDMEDDRLKVLPKEQVTEIAKAWCDFLEGQGYWVGLYASRNFFKTYVDDAQLQGYSHWVAEWTRELTYQGNENVCGMWQFGGSVNLLRSDMVAGRVVDQDYLLIDYPTKIRAAGLNGFGTTEGFLPARGYFQRGDSGEKIRKINDFWYRVFPAYADGLKRNAVNVLGPIFGENTEAWTKEFQQRTNLVPDGFIGPLTLQKMEEYGFRP